MSDLKFPAVLKAVITELRLTKELTILCNLEKGSMPC